MTLKSYLWGMRISAALSFAAWVLVLWFVDPQKSGIAGEVLFLGSTFLFFAGILILFFTWLRKNVGGSDQVALAYLGVSFRQGILVAVLLIVLLILQQFRVLVWWDGALIVAAILLAELYFLTRN